MPLFTVNFRREAYLKEIARARRRLLMVAAWVAYFGVVGAAMGLYGLNCVSLSRRSVQLESMNMRLEVSESNREEWKIPTSEIDQVERYLTNPRRWHDRLARIAEILPGDTRITSLAVNPNNLSGRKNENRLVISGQIRVTRGDERMSRLMDFVSALRSDTVFSAGYENINLASSRALGGGSSMSEFVIECQ